MEITMRAYGPRGNVEIEMNGKSNVVEAAQAVAIMGQLKGSATVIVEPKGMHFSVTNKALELAGLSGLAAAKHVGAIKF